MSHLRSGRHLVTVTPIVAEDGPYGPEEAGESVQVRCNVQPLSAAETQGLGLGVRTVYRIKYFPSQHGGVPWPGGPYSTIRWQGGTYQQQGEALLSSMSPVTGHYKVIMVSASSEVR